MLMQKPEKEEREETVGLAADSLLITNIGELVTVAPDDGPRRGDAMRNVGVIADAAVFIENGVIRDVGEGRIVALRHAYARRRFDAEGGVVLPGFVDPHTHLVFSGSREEELEMKVRGASYEDIARAGGGLLSTVRRTRQALEDDLVEGALRRLRRMFRFGTTTAEAKSGYGLNLDAELRLLRVIRRVADLQPVDLVPTFLGAHAVPPEYAERDEEYVEDVVTRMLPAVAQEGLARFCDAWCDDGYFTAEQCGRILRAAKGLGLEPKLHADELGPAGGAELAAEVGAASADHLLHATDEGLDAMAAAGVVAVLLPGTCFSSSLPYPDARRFAKRGVPVAVGTDLNPNCWTENMQFVLSLACYGLRMTPPEAIVAATLNAAHAVNRADRVGSIEPGKAADLVVFDADNHRQLPYRFGGDFVRAVVKGGQVHASVPPRA
jgi:imidazolonepropionase